ncbi:MAG: hypothetical protein RDV41_08645 [Planctomycetota bacterium]|nr:hypothetical protein [Planctomycetota bacterium]
MSQEQQLWIMVDIETSGPVFGQHSMTELGAAVGSIKRGVFDRFEALIQPIGDSVVTSTESFERAKKEGRPPAVAMEKFYHWTFPHLRQKPSFVARPAAFDWPWIVYYAWRYLGTNPFGFKAVCASSWLEALGRRFDVKLPHVAVKDAEIQLQYFLRELAQHGTVTPAPSTVASPPAREGLMFPGGKPLHVARARTKQSPPEPPKPPKLSVPDGMRVDVLQDNSIIDNVSFSPDGRRLAVSMAGCASVWDIEQRREILRYGEHTRTVYAVAFSPDGKLVASGDGDDLEKPGTVHVWDAVSGETKLILKGHTWSVTSLAFRPDGAELESGSLDASVRIWDLRTGKRSVSFMKDLSEVKCVAYSPDGKTLAVADDGAFPRPGFAGLWTSSGRFRASLSVPDGGVHGVAFSPDGGCVAAACEDTMVRLMDTKTGNEICVLRGHERAVNCAAFSPDGRLLASGSRDKTVRIWDVSSGQVLMVLGGHESHVNCLAFSPDGNLLACGGGEHYATGVLAIYQLAGLDRKAHAAPAGTETADSAAPPVAGDNRWDRMIEHARKRGPIAGGHFRVMVLEADLRTTHKDFTSLDEAKSYATDAASESDDTPPIAVVIDSDFRVVFEGKPYYAS